MPMGSPVSTWMLLESERAMMMAFLNSTVEAGLGRIALCFWVGYETGSAEVGVQAIFSSTILRATTSGWICSRMARLSPCRIESRLLLECEVQK